MAKFAPLHNTTRVMIGVNILGASVFNRIKIERPKQVLGYPVGYLDPNH